MWLLKSHWTETPRVWRLSFVGLLALTLLLSAASSFLSQKASKLKTQHISMAGLLDTIEKAKNRSARPQGQAFLSIEKDGDPADFLIRKTDEFGLRLIGIRPGDEVKVMRGGRGYTGKQVGVRVQGDFSSVYRYLKALETGKVFVFDDEYVLERLDDRLVDADLRLFFPTGETP